MLPIGRWEGACGPVCARACVTQVWLQVLASNYEVGSSQKLFCGWTPGPSGWAAINGYGPNWTHAIGQFKVYSDWPLVCTYKYVRCACACAAAALAPNPTLM